MTYSVNKQKKQKNKKQNKNKNKQQQEKKQQKKQTTCVRYLVPDLQCHDQPHHSPWNFRLLYFFL